MNVKQRNKCNDPAQLFSHVGATHVSWCPCFSTIYKDTGYILDNGLIHLGCRKIPEMHIKCASRYESFLWQSALGCKYLCLHFRICCFLLFVKVKKCETQKMSFWGVVDKAPINLGHSSGQPASHQIIINSQFTSPLNVA